MCKSFCHSKDMFALGTLLCLLCWSLTSIKKVKKTKVYLVKAMLFPVVMYGCESWTIKKSTKELMLLKCGVGEDSSESLGLQGDQTSPS